MKSISKILLEIKAVFIRPKNFFEWTKGGLKGPMYCDNRLILSFPKERDVITKAMAERIKKEYPDVEMLMGVSTSGIPFAAIVADILNLPMGYVRSLAKSYGRANRIEGKVVKGQKVVVIEDLIASGQSAMDVAIVLEEAGLEVLGFICIYTYNLPVSHTLFSRKNQKYVYLTDFNELIEVALENDFIKGEDIKILTEWKTDYDKTTAE